MIYEWDEEKNALNRRKHGIGFEAMRDFRWDFAVGPVLQYAHGEEREKWTGPVANTLVTAILTIRGPKMRVISLRTASREEKRHWRAEIHD